MYLVIAYRWGDTECHSYPVGVYRTMRAAGDAAVSERNYRGGKYECKIYFVNKSNEWTDTHENLIKELKWNS